MTTDNILGATLEQGGEFLSQYGVLGMKWGVRKERSSRKPKKPDAPEFTESRANKKQRTRKLTNAEIRKTNERLQLEKQLAQLKRDQALINRGNTAIKGYLALATTAGAVYTFTKTPLGVKLIQAGKDYIAKLK